jgi:hypothetical protein
MPALEPESFLEVRGSECGRDRDRRVFAMMMGEQLGESSAPSQ